MAEVPNLFYEEPDVIYNRMISRYGTLVNRPILAQQAEALIFRTITFELVLVKAQGDGAVRQSLAATAEAPMLDYLAGNTGLKRLAATPAVTTLVFQLLAGHGSVILPAGTKVRSQDGLVVFATDEEKSAAPGTDTITVTATALLDGPQGNLYAPSLISDLIDPQAFVTSVANIDVTAGGADIEVSDGLRRRILISQNQYSTAGSNDSYKFWALTANPSIIDVAVVSPKDEEGNSIGGQVLLYPLVSGGIDTPQAILDAVKEAVSGELRRPLTDKVDAFSPTKVNYAIPLELVLKHGAVQSTTEAAVIAAITIYALNQAKKLGADVTESQIIAAGMNGSVHSIRLTGFTDVIVNPTEFAVCTEINKISTTYEDINA